MYINNNKIVLVVMFIKDSGKMEKENIRKFILEYCILITWSQPNVLSLAKFPNRDFNMDDKR